MASGNNRVVARLLLASVRVPTFLACERQSIEGHLVDASRRAAIRARANFACATFEVGSACQSSLLALRYAGVGVRAPDTSRHMKWLAEQGGNRALGLSAAILSSLFDA